MFDSLGGCRGGGGTPPPSEGGGGPPPPLVDPNPAPFPAGPVQARKHTKLTRCTVNGHCFAALQHFQSSIECCLEFAQRPFLPLVTNHRHICREAKGATDIERERERERCEGRGGASSFGIILPLVACPLAGTLGASTTMTMPPRQCLLPSLCGECFPGCLLPSLCGECIGIGLGFSTHGFGFGHCAGWKFCDTGYEQTNRLTNKSHKLVWPQQHGV